MGHRSSIGADSWRSSCLGWPRSQTDCAWRIASANSRIRKSARSPKSKGAQKPQRGHNMIEETNVIQWVCYCPKTARGRPWKKPNFANATWAPPSVATLMYAVWWWCVAQRRGAWSYNGMNTNSCGYAAIDTEIPHASTPRSAAIASVGVEKLAS